MHLRWDGVRLWAGDRVIRLFKKVAPRTGVLLAAFEARGWSADPVPDPFPKEPWEKPEDVYNRLRMVVENLNRRQHPQKVRFHLSGNYVWYELVGQRSRAVRRRPRLQTT